MKFYNVFSGFLTGATREAFEKNVGDRVFNSLHSYWYLKDMDDEKIFKGFSLTKGNIMIDSGAFTAWTKKITIDVDTYLNWINKWDEYVTTFGQIDVIPPKVNNSQIIEECCQRTWQNYLYMTSRMKSPKKLLYTFHFGENFKWLKNALEYKDEEGKPFIEYMAFGGLVGRTVKERTEFLDECFRIIKSSSNPNVKIHGFGVSSQKMWRRYPFESCDSFTPGMNANHGFSYDEFGSYRADDYDKIFKPRGKTAEEQAQIDAIEAAKSPEVLKAEALQRTDDKTKLLIDNIEYWTNLANSIPKTTYSFSTGLF